MLKKILAHREPRLERLNLFAVMLGTNQLLYAPTLVLFVGRAGWLAWPVALTFPAFMATPWVLRRSSLAGRLWIPSLGILDTLLAQQALGRDSGVWAFLLPSLGLAALLLERSERVYLAALAAAAMAVLLFLPGGEVLPPATALTVTRLNAGSVVVLTAFIGWLFSGKAKD